MTEKEKAKAYDEAIAKAQKELQSCGSKDCDAARQIYRFFPELAESEDERVRKWLIDTIKSVPNDSIEWDVIDKSDVLAWLEKQGKSSGQIHYWTEEEIEPIISDYLRGAEHYGGMIARLRCLKPKSLEKQVEQKLKWSENDEHHWMMCLECVEECAFQDREDFSKTIDWLKSLKQRMEEQ